MSKITIREIKERYRASKEKERRFKWTYYVRRPISYYLAWPFLALGISATKVTILWLALAIASCFIIATGGYANIIIGTALLEFAVILDCVDGHIARFTRPTRTGDIIDTWAGEILLVGGLFSIGIGLSNSPGLMVSNRIIPFMIDSQLIIIIGGLVSLASLSSWTIRLHWRSNAMKFIPTSTGDNPEPDSNLRNKKALLIVDNLFHYSGALTMIMVVASLLSLLDVFLLLLGLIYAIYLFTVMYQIIRKAQALDFAMLENNKAGSNAKLEGDNGIDND